MGMPNSLRKRMPAPDEHGISVEIKSATARLIVVGTFVTGFLVWLLDHWLK